MLVVVVLLLVSVVAVVVVVLLVRLWVGVGHEGDGVAQGELPRDVEASSTRGRRWPSEVLLLLLLLLLRASLQPESL